MRLPDRQEIARLSRDRSFLVKLSLGLVLTSTVAAFAVSSVFRKAPHFPISLSPLGEDLGTSLESLIALIRFGNPDFAQIRFHACTKLLRHPGDNPFSDEIEEAVARISSSTPHGNLVAVWWRGLSSDHPGEAIAELESMDSGRRHRSEFIGDLLMKLTEPELALKAYLEEADRSDGTGYSRRSALVLARFFEDRKLLQRLLADPEYRGSIPPGEILPLYAYAGDYAGLARSVIRFEWQTLRSPYLLPALFTASIWFLILTAFRPVTWPRFARMTLAFLLGALSTVPTLFAAIYQEHARGFSFNPEDTSPVQFFYFVAGIGLREEFLKLVCLLPLILIFRSRITPVEALQLGGMTGLGFAFQENLIYFEADAGTYSAWLRLLTANALHFSLTGVAGFQLWRMTSRKARGWEDFLASFLLVVFAHGLYNALLAVPSLSYYAPLSPILVAVLAYQYFDPLRQHMESAGMHRRISPLGVFVIGSVTLACTILISSAAVEPFRFALGAFAATSGAMIPLAFAFISRFRDL